MKQIAKNSAIIVSNLDKSDDENILWLNWRLPHQKSYQGWYLRIKLQ